MDLGKAQQVLLQCLTKTIDPIEQRVGEQQLAQLSTEKGFGVVLSSLCSNPQVPGAYRQLAGVVLRQYVEKHWDDGTESFVEPLASDEDKASIRSVLPKLLGDADTKIQTAASMAIAAIASVDYPEQWPNLVDLLIAAINSDNNPILVQGGLRCLVLFAEEITDQQLKHVIPHLFPALLRALANGSYPTRARMRAVTVYRICTQSLYTLSAGDAESEEDDDDLKLWRQFQALLNPTLPMWLQAFQSVLDPSSRQEGFGLRLECIRTLKTLCLHFPKLIEPHINVFMDACWTLLQQCYPMYEKGIIQGEDTSADELYDEEGEAMGLTAFVCEIFEFFTQIVEMPPAVQHRLLQAMSDLLVAAVRYMQMTHEDIVSWEEDPNEYIAFEEDFVQAISVRVGGHKLFTRVLDVFGHGEGAVESALKAVQQCFQESEQQRSANQEHWWKLKEAAMFALGFIADELGEEENKLDLTQLVATTLIPEMGNNGQAPYIRARAIWCVSHFPPVFEKEGAKQLGQTVLRASLAALQPSEVLPVRMAAAKAIGVLSASLDKEEVAPYVPNALPLMCELLQHATAETLHLSLDTLVVIVGLNHEATQAVCGELVPLLLRTWSMNAADHIVTEGIVEIMETMAGVPACCNRVQELALPTVLNILNSQQQHYSGTIEAAVDLLASLLKASEKLNVVPHASFLNDVLPLVLNTVLASDDTSVLESGTLLLTHYVRILPGPVAQASFRGTPVLAVLCDTVSKLLSPELSDAAARAVGGLVTQMVFKLSEKLGQDNVAHLIKAVVIRMYSAEFPDLIEGLLLVFARLFHAHGLQILSFLSQAGELPVKKKIVHHTPATPDCPYPAVKTEYQEITINAMTFVLGKWCQGQADFHYPYPTKVSLTALLHLLDVADDSIANIPVQGYPIIDQKAKRKTRSQSKGESPLKFTQIPLATKIMSLAVQEWKEQKEARIRKEQGGDDEDEGDDDDDEDFSFQLKGKPTSSVFADADDLKFMNLSDLIGMQGGDDDDDIEEEMYPESVVDPINKIDLEHHLKTSLLNLTQKQQQRVQAFVQHLSKEDKATFQEALRG